VRGASRLVRQTARCKSAGIAVASFYSSGGGGSALGRVQVYVELHSEQYEAVAMVFMGFWRPTA
jgi:hypothetical protein